MVSWCTLNQNINSELLVNSTWTEKKSPRDLCLHCCLDASKPEALFRGKSGRLTPGEQRHVGVESAPSEAREVAAAECSFLAALHFNKCPSSILPASRKSRWHKGIKS